MRWRGRRQSSNVQDQRGQGGGFGRGLGRGGGLRIPIGRSGGGGGMSGIVIIVIIFIASWLFGLNPMEMLSGGSSGGGGQVSRPNTPANDERGQFAGVVLAETEDVWNGIFQAEGQTYAEPAMVLFSGEVRSTCGFASSAAGPFYCPGDRKVYIDLDFFDQLDRQFGAAGDFAQAYVIAHEVGHHVQNLIGVLPKFNQMRQRMDQAEQNRMSTRVELQADCFAGIWAHFTEQKGLLEDGDIEEAINAAHQIGDDTLQKKTEGYVVPESFNHGTSAQRAEWFGRGLRSGRLADCDTFNAAI